MKLSIHRCIVLAITLFSGHLGHSATNPAVAHHNMNVEIFPVLSVIVNTDTIDLRQLKINGDRYRFTLHQDLRPRILKGGGKLFLVSKSPDSLAATYELAVESNQESVSITYSGIINHPTDQEFSPGTISSSGVALLGSTHWFPIFENELFTAEIEVAIPRGWQTLTQGIKSTNLNGSESWKISQPTDMLYLMAGQWHRFESKKGDFTAQVLLRKEGTDEPPEEQRELAETYLSATHQYAEHYASEIGSYPYSQFTLLENFWETGYGMPAFTLLGPSVIRLPFIIYSSYPHEILHNWWGNGVFVDYASGNWVEGLTTYMADHWLQQQRRQGSNYRRTTLQKYKHYVRDGNDFPLVEFKGRHGAASAAVGYGKSMMFFHMLKQRLGSDQFKLGLRTFYTDHKFKNASYWDIQRSLEGISEQNLTVVFEQWLTRKGAPKISLNHASTNPNSTGKFLTDRSGHRLALTLQQQAPKLYDLQIPVQVEFEFAATQNLKLPLTESKKSYELNFKDKPTRVFVDPNFDLFRWVYEEEIPAALSSSIGEERQLLAILPRSSSKTKIARYNTFVEQLQSYFEKPISVIYDDQEPSPEKDVGVWVLGWNNRYITKVDLESHKVKKSDTELRFAGTTANKNTDSIGLAFKRPKRSGGGSLFWLSIADDQDLAALARKLPHYGKYSYLTFQHSKNTVKGQWTTSNSPLSKEL